MYLIVPGKVKGTLFPESCLFTQNQAWCCLFYCDHFIITAVLIIWTCVSGMEGWPQDRWEQTQIEEWRPSTGREGQGAAFGPLEISRYYPIRAHCVGILMKSQNKRVRKPCPIIKIQWTLWLGCGYFTLSLFKKLEWLFLTTPSSTSDSGMGIQTSFFKKRRQFWMCFAISRHTVSWRSCSPASNQKGNSQVSSSNIESTLGECGCLGPGEAIAQVAFGAGTVEATPANKACY